MISGSHKWYRSIIDKDNNIEKSIYNYTIKSVHPRKIDDVIISSSVIRKKIKSGNMDTVSKFVET